jgi:signal transduction histidine kinase/CheY-like chemotaxis protein
MSRVERSMDHQLNSFSLFETAIALDGKMRQRTKELQDTLRSLEISNRELFRAKIEAETANVSKTTFLASLSHDLLQPLNAARLATSALYEVDMADEGAGLLIQIERSLATLEELIRTLLDISKLDAGVLKPEPRSFCSTAILQPLIEEFKQVALRRGLKLRLKKSGRHALHSDPLMLRRILQNLVSNALRYTKRGGVTIGCRRQGENVVIEIADTGPGIPPDRREAVFEEFRRYDVSADGQVGFGLGLAIVRRLALTLHHPIGLKSKLGLGSIFSVSVPLGLITEIEAPAPAPSPRMIEKSFGFSGASVILVENEPDVAEAMQTLLRRWGCEVLIAASADESVEVLDELGRAPDLVISDLHLNHGSRGYDAIEAIRAKTGLPVKGFIITADHTQKATADIAARGFEVLKKPVKPAELRALVSYMLSSG